MLWRCAAGVWSWSDEGQALGVPCQVSFEEDGGGALGLTGSRHIDHPLRLLSLSAGIACGFPPLPVLSVTASPSSSVRAAPSFVGTAAPPCLSTTVRPF